MCARVFLSSRCSFVCILIGAHGRHHRLSAILNLSAWLGTCLLICLFARFRSIQIFTFRQTNLIFNVILSALMPKMLNETWVSSQVKASLSPVVTMKLTKFELAHSSSTQLNNFIQKSSVDKTLISNDVFALWPATIRDLNNNKIRKIKTMRRKKLVQICQRK